MGQIVVRDAPRTMKSGITRDVLDNQLATYQTTVLHLPFCQIHDEKSFESIVAIRNQTVVSKALEAT